MSEPRGYMASSKSTEWQTPKELFDRLWLEFGGFDLDPCGQREHHYTAWMIESHGGAYYDGSTQALDGLTQPWGPSCVLPLTLLERAERLIVPFTLRENIGVNTPLQEGSFPTDSGELQGDDSLVSLRHHVGQDDSQNRRGLESRNIPSPRDSFVQLARLLDTQAPDRKQLLEAFNRWPMDHLHLQHQEIRRRAFRAARSFSEAAMDIDAALSIDNTSGPSDTGVHTDIIHHLGGFIQARRPWRVFLNPPYGPTVKLWVAKAVSEVAWGNAELVVALLKATTDVQWWHQYVEGIVTPRFIKGRLKFGGTKGPAPFPSVIIVWRKAPGKLVDLVAPAQQEVLGL